MENKENVINYSRKATVVAFAKNPLLEPVKTRLAASIGQEMARKVFDALFLDCLSNLKHLKEVTRFIACSPNSQHIYFERLAEQFDMALMDQAGDDLGERMSNCINMLCDRIVPIVIVGTDTPILPVDQLNYEFSVSNEWDVLLGPTFDGGYYLIAMTRYLPEVFENVNWSTNRVLEQTRHNCLNLNLRLRELPPALDIDDLDSLKSLKLQLSNLSDTDLFIKTVFSCLELNTILN